MNVNKNFKQFFLITLLAITLLIIGIVVFILLQPPALKSIELNYTKLTIDMLDDEEKILHYSALPENGEYDKIKWKSSDEKVAKVKSNGLIKPVAAGKCEIIAYSGDVKGKCNIIITDSRIVGTWNIDKSNGEGNDAIYYTFKEDGTAELIIGTQVMKGKWKYYDKATNSTTTEYTNMVEINISYYFNGIFTVEMGKDKAVNRRLKLINSENNSFVLKNSNIPKSTIKPEKDFNPDLELVGEWNNGISGFTYIFNLDGTFQINQYDTLFINGVYNVASGKIVIQYITDEKVSKSLDYQLKGSTLKISDLEGEMELERVN